MFYCSNKKKSLPILQSNKLLNFATEWNEFITLNESEVIIIKK